MKRTLFNIVFLFFSIQSFAQTQFNASISLDYMNVIYTTVDNSISIQTNAPTGDVECTINKDGIVEKGRFNSYIVRVSKEGNYQFKITQKSTGAAISYSLRAKRLPLPIANIDNNLGDSITTQQLSSAKELQLTYVPAFDFNISAEVISFSIIKISKNNTRNTLTNFSGVFSNEAKALLKSCVAGDILLINSILANGVDPGILKISSINLFVY